MHILNINANILENFYISLKIVNLCQFQILQYFILNPHFNLFQTRPIFFLKSRCFYFINFLFLFYYLILQFLNLLSNFLQITQLLLLKFSILFRQRQYFILLYLLYYIFICHSFYVLIFPYSLKYF